MTLRGVDTETVIKKMDEFSGAEIKAVCTEAGYFAIRKGRTHITQHDVLKAIDKVKASEEREGKDYIRMFG
jgi:proteasome regulatory subunit